MFKKYFTLTFIFVLSIALVGCNRVANNQNSQPAINNTQQDSVVTQEQIQEDREQADMTSGDGGVTEEDMNKVKVFELEGGMFYFTPNEIRVKEGDTVRVVLNNKEGMHDWVVDEFNARTEIVGAGETTQVEFVADKKGVYEFYCSVGQHRANGMIGKLIVE